MSTGTNENQNENIQDTMSFITETLGPYHLKEKAGGGVAIANGSNKYFVVHKLLIRKVPGQNNRIEIQMIMPKPEDVEVIEVSKEK